MRLACAYVYNMCIYKASERKKNRRTLQTLIKTPIAETRVQFDGDYDDDRNRNHNHQTLSRCVSG